MQAASFRYMFGFMAMTCLAAPAHAEGLLAVAPLRLVLGDKSNELVTLTNRSDKTKTYKVVMQDQEMQADGTIVNRDDFAYSAKRMLRFMPRQVTLAPGQRQNIRVMAVPPEGLADGDYHTHLIFDQVKDATATDETTEKGFRVKLENMYSVGIPVIVQHGKVEGGIRLSNAKLIDDRGRVFIRAELARSGNGEASGRLTVLDKASGQAITAARNVHIYRERDTVILDLPVKGDAVAGLTSKALQAKLEIEGREGQTLDVTP